MIDHDLFKNQRNYLKALHEQAKANYIKDKLNRADSSKDTFSILNTLLHKTNNRPLPKHDDPLELAESFATFFTEKVSTVRRGIGANDTDTPQGSLEASGVNKLETFKLVQEEEVNKLISSSASKSCALDPLPTNLIKQCPAIFPLLGHIINHSLSTGCMPQLLKEAHVSPVLKKASLNQNELKSYRPVSNLAYSSKLIERVVSERLEEHCAANNVTTCFQSAYKKLHSTETALTRVQNDLLKAVDSQGGAILVLLDLSAAFDTIDHDVLLNTLKSEVGVEGKALQWFRSYLSGRLQRVKIGTSLSSPQDLRYGVPQGSVLGPQLFSLYTKPLIKVIEINGMIYHIYADDTQLYISFQPKCTTSTAETLRVIEICTSNINSWMKSHFLKLNGDKTEMLVITTPSLSGHHITHVDICGSKIDVSKVIRDLGVLYDTTLKMDAHIKTICKRVYYQIHLISKVRQYITESDTRTLIQANVTSLLDYCNGLLIGLPNYLIDLLQHAQNCAARVIKRIPRSSHISPVLKELHWLPIKYRIQYKTILLTFKCLNRLAPSYLCDLLHPYVPSRSLRSQNDNLLIVQPYKLQAYGGRSFEVTAPKLWNNLPAPMRKLNSITVFKTSLKTHLCNLAFD